MRSWIKPSQHMYRDQAMSEDTHTTLKGERNPSESPVVDMSPLVGKRNCRLPVDDLRGASRAMIRDSEAWGFDCRQGRSEIASSLPASSSF